MGRKQLLALLAASVVETVETSPSDRLYHESKVPRNFEGEKLIVGLEKEIRSLSGDKLGLNLGMIMRIVRVRKRRWRGRDFVR